MSNTFHVTGVFVRKLGKDALITIDAPDGGQTTFPVSQFVGFDYDNNNGAIIVRLAGTHFFRCAKTVQTVAVYDALEFAYAA